MSGNAIKTDLPSICRFRSLYLNELNAQCRYNACHERGWSDSYLLTIDGAVAGHGSVKGQQNPDRDTIFEFFVMREFRDHSRQLFGALLIASGAAYIECQSNDPILPAMILEFGREIRSDTLLFADHNTSELTVPAATVRRRREDDRIFAHRHEPVGEHVLEIAGDIVATGGFALHYNPPFADLYMEVREDCRHRGFGSFLVQELKRECRNAGRVPAARCNFLNAASRKTLIKSGMRICGCMLLGDV